MPIVYVDFSDIDAGRVDELRLAISELVSFVKQREPQLVEYGFYVDPAEATMAVVAVHPDSASLELHLRVGGPEFLKVGQFIRLRAIEVFGAVPEHVIELLRQKAERLGGAAVRIHQQTAGFTRLSG